MIRMTSIRGNVGLINCFVLMDTIAIITYSALLAVSLLG